MRVEVGVAGIEKLSNQLNKLGIDINKGILEGLTKSAIKVESEAKKLCVIDTGRLRSNITHEINVSSKNEITARVGTNVFYAPFIEFGTRRHLAPVGIWGKRHGFGKATWLWVSGKAKPFLYPALQKSMNFIRNQLKQEININIGRG